MIKIYIMGMLSDYYNIDLQLNNINYHILYDTINNKFSYYSITKSKNLFTPSQAVMPT